MRWLLLKDLQILRRSPLLLGLLVLYPVAIALMIGFALSSPPSKPKVAIYDAIPAGHRRLRFGAQEINIGGYQKDLFAAIDPIRVASQAQAIGEVRSGRALAALIVPADLPGELESLIRTGVGSPTVQLYLNSRDPLERQYVQQAIDSRITAVQGAVSKQVLRLAVGDLQLVLRGGTINLLGQGVHLLGLRSSRRIVQRALAAVPAHSALAAALRRVVAFAGLAIEGLSFAGPVLGSIGSPLTVQQIQLAGRTTPTDTYAVAIAVAISLMFVSLLLAAGMLALERAEHVYARLVRGLVSPDGLLAEKIALAGALGAALALALSMIVAGFVALDWSRFALWVLAVVFGGVAFGALGTAVGVLARELSAASLLAFLLSLPVAFVSLVPATAVSGAARTLLDVVAFLFPFRAALEAIDNGFAATSPGIGLPLVHLLALALAFGGVARVGLRRFGAA